MEIVRLLSQLDKVGLTPGMIMTSSCVFEEHDECPYKTECDCKCHKEEEDTDDNDE